MLGYSPFLTAYILFLTVVFGLVLGSFANCMAWRIVHGEKVSKGRSHCAVCGHPLSPGELIPLFSWLIQKGRCRHCGEKISIRYPLTEVICAVAFILVVLHYDVTLQAVQFLILTVILLSAALVDLDSGMIPDRLILAGILNFIIFTVASGGQIGKNLLSGFLHGLALLIPLLILTLVMDRILKKESMGGGDLKLFFMVGIYFSFGAELFMLLLSCILGIAFTLIFQNIRIGDPENPKAFPFGPAIAAAALISIIAAQSIVDFYLHLF